MKSKFKTSTKFFFKSIEKERKKEMLFLTILLIFSSFFEFLTIGTIVPLLSSLLDQNFNQFKFLETFQNYFEVENFFFYFLIIFIIFVIISVIFRAMVIKYNEKFSALLASDLSSKIFHKTITQDYSVIISQNSNNLISGMTEKITMYSGLVTGLLSLVSSIFISIGIIFYLFVFSYKITIISLVLIVFIISILILISRSYLDKNGKIASLLSEQRFKIVQEAVSGIRDVIISNSYSLIINSYKTIELKFRLSLHRLNFAQNSPKLLIEAFGIIMLLLTCFFVFKLNMNNEKEFIINLAVFAFAAQKLLPLVNTIFNSWASLKSYFYIIEDIHTLLNRNNEVNSNITTKHKEIFFKNDIIFKNVSFKYKDSPKNIFNNLNIKLDYKTINGFIGRTGSGKSTFLDLLIGLLKPSSGKILIDGMELGINNLNSWHQKISHVPQNSFILNSTLKDNIALNNFGNNINEERISKVCKEANIDEFLKDLPDGLNTIIGERGLNLSGGQRQRITIARALYANKPILILDEATNALDYETEEQILNNINNNYSDKTILMVSHRIENLKFVDKIINLSE